MRPGAALGTTARLAALVVACLVGMAASGGSVLSFEIHGKVQGVFFRKHTQAQAAKLKLRGWCEVREPTQNARARTHFVRNTSAPHTLTACFGARVLVEHARGHGARRGGRRRGID